MSEIILYPTETIYGLGVNAFDETARAALAALKGRKAGQIVSLLVRDRADIERYAVVTPQASKLIDTYLPGSLTIGLEPLNSVPQWFRVLQPLISFRISPDPVAKSLIAEYMNKNGGVPLTCTSANVHGLPALATPEAILRQFGDRADMITNVVDDGPREGVSSTVVECVAGAVTIIREGAITIDPDLP